MNLFTFLSEPETLFLVVWLYGALVEEFLRLVHLALVVLKPTDGQLQEFLVARYGRVALSCNAKY